MTQVENDADADADGGRGGGGDVDRYLPYREQGKLGSPCAPGPVKYRPPSTRSFSSNKFITFVVPRRKLLRLVCRSHSDSF